MDKSKSESLLEQGRKIAYDAWLTPSTAHLPRPEQAVLDELGKIIAMFIQEEQQLSTVIQKWYTE